MYNQIEQQTDQLMIDLQQCSTVRDVSMELMQNLYDQNDFSMTQNIEK